MIDTTGHTEQHTESLIADLVEWIDTKPRPYVEVMQAWRTSCPRLTIWEDTIDRGYLRRVPDRPGNPMIAVTRGGQAFLRTQGRIGRPAIKKQLSC